MVLDEMVTRVLTTVPQPLEPLTCQPLMSIGEPVMLYSSMNSSLPPFGPRVRNSLITTESDGVCVAVGVEVLVAGAGVLVFVGAPGVLVLVGGKGVLVAVKVG